MPIVSFSRLKQKGDTIVEVLIAITVVSVVLVGAYVTTIKNTNSTLDAQERGQAIGLVESQIEFLRSTNGNLPSGDDCFNGAGTGVADNGHLTDGSDPCVFGNSGSQATAGLEPSYRIDTVKNSPSCNSQAYGITATWDSATQHGKDTIIMCYRPS